MLSCTCATTAKKTYIDVGIQSAAPKTKSIATQTSEHLQMAAASGSAKHKPGSKPEAQSKAPAVLVVRPDQAGPKESKNKRKKKKKAKKSQLEALRFIAPFRPVNTRSRGMVQEIVDEIKLLADTYVNSVKAVIPPTENTRGEIKVMLENSHYPDVDVHVEFKLVIPFEYPSLAPTLELVGCHRVEAGEAAALLRKAQLHGESLSSVGEQSIQQVVMEVYKDLEEVEEAVYREILSKKRKEEEETEWRKRRDEELKMLDELNEQENRRIQDKIRMQEEQEKQLEEQQRANREREKEEREKNMNKLIRGERIEVKEDYATFALKKHKIDHYIHERKLSNGGLTPPDDPERKKSERSDPAFDSSLHEIEETQHDIDDALKSRFKNDFVLCSQLGKGGFGQVFKVKNKLDGNYYAVKRLILKYRAPKELLKNKILLEVQVLSQLHHMHIVRYFQAWTEAIPEEDKLKIKNRISSDDSAGEEEDEEEGEEEHSSEYGEEPENESDSSSFGEQGEKEQAGSKKERSFQLVFLDSNDNFNTKSKVKHPSKDDFKRFEPREPQKEDTKMKYLFIQMECCELLTLREFIDNGELRTNGAMFIQLITQLLEGFTYIHQHGMIHRDVKPANVFLDKKKNIKIGDFGLATTGGLFKETDKEEAPEQAGPRVQDHESMGAVGTFLYMSPEQAKGHKYDCKADMYSLGIIMFEMLYGPFKTDSQRILSIEALRRDSTLPKDFDKKSETIMKDVGAAHADARGAPQAGAPRPAAEAFVERAADPVPGQALPRHDHIEHLGIPENPKLRLFGQEPLPQQRRLLLEAADRGVPLVRSRSPAKPRGSSTSSSTCCCRPSSESSSSTAASTSSSR